MGSFASKTKHSHKVADQLEEEKKQMARPRSIASTNWRELGGEHHWRNLLDPLDINLRRYIIHYGEMAEATYDAFDSDKASKHARRSRYGKRDFFSKVGLEHGNPFKYKMTKFLYATSEIDFLILDNVEESNWMGYVAVATDEGKAVLGRRDIVIAWRGTEQVMEWIKDLQFLLDDAPYIFGDTECKVHRGFYSVYTATNSHSNSKSSARTQVLTEIRRLVDKYKDEEISITITGHSLGAALATLNAVDIVSNGYNIREDESQKACPVTAIVFASPRVGDSDFKEFSCSQKDLRILRIRNKNDIVPRHPFLGYDEVGEELEIDTQKSNFLKQPGDLKSWHNLEVYLHGVTGTQGSKGGFNLEVKRDIALVNKGMGALKDEYNIPVAWKIDQNRGLVQQPNGGWKMLESESESEDDYF
ncbi:phospholipase A1-IIgamma-like [Prosopis cineraria]|uniref:phospholipase A1-IIgamma-like n=1 Tax=Prosopis cineraria TaxID=364024 RepID=UPI00240F3040|nr:phospholipase A1-IIgamma-like [Prosopis cineraria]XP_054778233.1 phospholipase A1-IIgamma-like [Prosopis cineraria]